MWASARFWRASISAAVLALAAFAAAPPPAPAALPETFDARPPFEPEHQALLARVESYLDAIDTLEARFIQVSSDGGAAEGRLWVNRPGRARFEYDPPTPLLVVADGVTLNILDLELEEHSSIPISTTPAYFLLRENISFADGLDVRALAREGNLIRVELVQTDAPEAGRVDILLSLEPMRLLQWTVIDPQGIETRVTLYETRFGGDISFWRFLVNRPWDRDGR